MLNCTAFAGPRLLVAGPLPEVAIRVVGVQAESPELSVLVFDDSTGRVVDLDLRGTPAEIISRLTQAEPAVQAKSQRGPGRPKLGVVAREVTLLPRHWEWLGNQPGGASVTLRKLVEAARKADGPAAQRRTAQDSAYRFMSAMAGNEPGFEEACRALFAGNRGAFERDTASWPPDIRAHAFKLAERAF